jgi:DNA-binding GntR family transcriptional regulator
VTGRYGIAVDGITTFSPDWPYQQLAALLRPIVRDMRPNQPLPSITHLSQQYQLSPKTVRKALGILEAEGLIFIVASRGAFKR